MLRMLALAPLLAMLALVACGKSVAEPPGADPSEAIDAGLSGTVLERIDVPPYSYLRIEGTDGEFWAAVPQVALAIGAIVTIDRPQPMDGFESKQLNRRFDRIFFGHLAGSPPSPEIGRLR